MQIFAYTVKFLILENALSFSLAYICVQRVRFHEEFTLPELQKNAHLPSPSQCK